MTLADQWATDNFSRCDLGDKRRTKRLTSLASSVLSHPSGSFPDQMPQWKNLKACYRLLSRPEVTHEAITEQHFAQTRKRCSGRYLILNDTTEFDFGNHREVEGLSQTGNGSGYGFLCHNALMVNACSSEVVGLAGQLLHYRKAAPKKESAAQKLKRKRESQIWGDLVDQIGPPENDEVEFIHVCDRGADNFEFFCHVAENRCGWLVRCSHTNRKIVASNSSSPISIKEFVATEDSLNELGDFELNLRARPGVAARTATLTMSAAEVVMPVPRHKSAYVRRVDAQPIAMNLLVLEEKNPPSGKKPLKWILLTSLAVKTYDQAWEVATYYEQRWLIEEYHKAQKTGCRITARQLSRPDRLEASTGLLSIVAVRLLQLKTVALADPDRIAEEIIPQLWIKMLVAARTNTKKSSIKTVGQFYKNVAMLGGFLGRKHDGSPGWITIWRGWQKLEALVRGAQLAKDAGVHL
jgi:hypothetical protein